MSKIIRLIDRTRTVADWKCPRARYWGYEYLGRGIVKDGNSLDLFIGIVIHDALASIATMTLNDIPVDIDEIGIAAGQQIYEELQPKEGVILKEAEDFANEQASLVEGLIRGFYKHIWPRLMDQYTIITTESEMEYPLDPDGNFVFMTKPDLIVEDKEGNLVYIEYKSTSSKKENWVNSWDTAVQLHSSIKATERSLGREVSGVQIVGLYKGYESYGKQSSPFCYAYKKTGNPPFTQDQIQYSYKAGFKRSPTWEMDGGLKAWVAAMPDNILADQFPLTPVINVNEVLVDSFFRQRLLREQTIQDAVEDMKEFPHDAEMIMDTAFSQRFDQCQPSFGYGCQFKKICHGFVADPLQEGFVFREPHHAQEREQMGLDAK